MSVGAIIAGLKMAALTQQRTRQFESAHTTVEATLIDRYTEEYTAVDGETYTAHYVAVQFDADGKPMTLTAWAGRIYETVRIGETLTVAYADADPVSACWRVTREDRPFQGKIEKYLPIQ
jgi:hypothetical protein